MKPSILAPKFFRKNSSYQILGLVAMAIIAVGMPVSFSVTQITLDAPKNSYAPGELISVKGQIPNSPDQLVAIEVKDPTGITIMVRTVKTGSDGNFALQFKLSSTAQSGNYDIIANSNINNNMLKATKSISASSTGMEQNTSTQTIHIPMWVKNNANLWSTGKITDSDFEMGTGYMIQHGIIVIPQTISNSDSSKNIPSWIKNDAGLWSEGQVSDSEFVRALQYLTTHGIVIVK
jgi:hypothetical protein